jgi:hypothetical protein
MLKPIMTLAAVCAVSLMAGCSNQAEEPVVPTYKTGLKASERNSSEFGKVFPQQYNSYLKNSEDGLDTETRFKASFHFRKNRRQEQAADRQAQRRSAVSEEPLGRLPLHVRVQ